jgi:hypothetical protein
MTSEFAHAASDTKGCHDSVRPRVLHLFGVGRPAAISRLVVSVDINSVKAHAFRSNSHISEKIPKVSPTITNCYPSTSVVFPKLVIWISATLDHMAPLIVSSTSSSSGRMAVLFIGEGNQGLSLASARFGVAGTKVKDSNKNSFSANAFATSHFLNGSGRCGSWRRFRNNFKTSEKFTDRTGFFRHNVDNPMLCSVVGVRVQTDAHCVYSLKPKGLNQFILSRVGNALPREVRWECSWGRLVVG